MKKIFALFILFVIQVTIAQTKIAEIEKNSSISYTWGLMKYLHPEISKGKFNWDQEFITLYEKLENINTNVQLNQELLSWIHSFESESTKKLYKKATYDQEKLFTKNYDYSWIETSNFDPNLMSKLHQNRENSNYGDFYASLIKLNNFINFNSIINFTNFQSLTSLPRLALLSSLLLLS